MIGVGHWSDVGKGMWQVQGGQEGWAGCTVCATRIENEVGKFVCRYV